MTMMIDERSQFGLDGVFFPFHFVLRPRLPLCFVSRGEGHVRRAAFALCVLAGAATPRTTNGTTRLRATRAAALHTHARPLGRQR
jgi:hypothetical protein